MNKIIVISTLLGVLVTFPARVLAIEQGKSAPLFTGVLLDGKSFSSESAQGQVIVINFWATWCPPYKDQGLRIIAVSLDDPADEAKVREVMQAYRFEGALDRQTQHKGYGRIWRIPLTFVIDRKGVLRKDGWFGPAGLDQPLLEKVVTPLLEEN